MSVNYNLFSSTPNVTTIPVDNNTDGFDKGSIIFIVKLKGNIDDNNQLEKQVNILVANKNGNIVTIDGKSTNTNIIDLTKNDNTLTKLYYSKTAGKLDKEANAAIAKIQSMIPKMNILNVSGGSKKNVRETRRKRKKNNKKTFRN
jgi:hypothetical protein